MPAPGITPLCKTILRLARAAEQGSAGAGLAYLNSLLAVLGTVLAAGGQQMVSASTAGKAFAFAAGWSNQAVADALDEAFGRWANADAAELALLLDSRRVTVTRGRFGWKASY